MTEKTDNTEVELLRTQTRLIVGALKPICSLLSSERINILLSDDRHKRAKSLTRYGFKAYSQNDEDGIIQEIFHRIGAEQRSFVEFGCGNGIENNTVYLLLQGWSGLWMDGRKENIQFISGAFQGFVEKSSLRIQQVTITHENINSLLRDEPHEPDLLSIDIDMNDYWVWSAIDNMRPRVVVIEYNSTIRPPASLVVPCDSGNRWMGGNYFGASLSALEGLGHDKGYALVGCNLTGTNAFFVRHDLLADHFLRPYTAETHYEPPEYNLFQNYVGSHPSDVGIYQEMTRQRSEVPGGRGRPQPPAVIATQSSK